MEPGDPIKPQQLYIFRMAPHKRPSCYRKTYGPPTAVPAPVPPGPLSKIMGKIRVDYLTKYTPRFAAEKPYPIINKQTKVPQCLEDVLPNSTNIKADARNYEPYLEWYRNNGWSDSEMEQLHKKIAKYEAEKESRNAHLDKVLSRYSGKTTSTVAKIKPLRVRFKPRAVKPVEEEGEGGDEDE